MTKRAFERSILKTFWEKGGNAGNQQSPLYHNVFYSNKEKLHSLSDIEIVCNCFQFGHWAQICCLLMG